MQPSNTLLAPSRFMSSDIRFVRSFVIVFVAFAALFLTACNQNTPDDTKKGGDTPTSQHQPSDPATWSPVGHKYVSIDNDTLDGRYIGWTVEFVTSDTLITFDGQYGNSITYHYRLEYPNVLLGMYPTHPTLVFKDTLTLTRYLQNDYPTYKLVY